MALNLERKKGESIVMHSNHDSELFIEVKVGRHDAVTGQTRLVINAPKHISIHRKEVKQRKAG